MDRPSSQQCAQDAYPAGDKDGGHAPPALQASPKCPRCGRRSAVVFPDVRRWRAGKSAPLVCLSCCPRIVTAS